MAVCRLNVTIQTVNNKFSALITTDLSTGIYSLFLSGIVSAGALCSATFYIPATFGIVNNMMRRTSHIITPYVLWVVSKTTMLFIG